MRYIRDLNPPWENPESVGTLDNGMKVVRVQTPWDYGMESYFLGHCLGSKDFLNFEVGHRAFSVRDTYGIPHATILCLKNGIVSPYQGSADLGTFQMGNIGGELLRIIQVRGRHDAPANINYLRPVRKWFMRCVDHLYQGVPDKIVDMHNFIFGDTDEEYHEHYMMDDEDNHWLGGHVGPTAAGKRGYLSY